MKGCSWGNFSIPLERRSKPLDSTSDSLTNLVESWSLGFIRADKWAPSKSSLHKLFEHPRSPWHLGQNSQDIPGDEICFFPVFRLEGTSSRGRARTHPFTRKSPTPPNGLQTEKLVFVLILLAMKGGFQRRFSLASLLRSKKALSWGHRNRQMHSCHCTASYQNNR